MSHLLFSYFNLTKFSGASGEEVNDLVSNIIAIVTSESFGSNYTEPVVQSLAAELYSLTVVTSCQQLTVYKDEISAALITIQSSIIYLIKEISSVQSQFVLFTGEEFSISTLTITVINESTGQIIETSGSDVVAQETEVN